MEKLQFSKHDPLNEQDTETQTYGCRAYDPEFCKAKGTNRCAFAREDNICLKPPRSWKKTFNEKKAQ